MSFAYVKEYTSFASDIDLTAEPPASAEATGVSRFEVLDAGGGGLALRIFGTFTNVVLTGLTAGDVQLLPDRILAAGTTVAKVRVWWNRRSR